jgi:hypothetical protein
MRGGCRLSEAHKLIAGDLDRVCLFALRKEPHRRYRSVDDMRNDLERILRGRKPVIARSGDPLYSALNSARRRPLEWMAGIAVVTALVSGYSVLRFLSDDQRRDRSTFPRKPMNQVFGRPNVPPSRYSRIARLAQLLSKPFKHAAIWAVA